MSDIAQKKIKAKSGKSALPQAKQQRQVSVTPLKAIKKLSSLRMIFSYIPPYKWLLFGGLLALLTATGFTLGIVRSLEWLIDGAFSASGPAQITPYFMVVFIAIAILGIATFFRVYFIALLGERVVADIRKAVHSNLLNLSPSYFETNRPSEIASRLTTDTTLIQTAVSAAIPIALHSGLQAIGALILIAMIDAILLIGVSVLAILIVLPVVLFGRRIRRLSRLSQDRIADVGARANESYHAIQVVQAFTREEQERDRFNSHVEKAYGIAKKRILTRSTLVFTIITLVYGFIAAGLFLGVKAVLAGTMTGGQLATLLGFSMIIATSMANLSEVLAILQRAAGAAGRLTELLAAKSDLPVPESVVELSNREKPVICFQDVSFGYPSKPTVLALKNFSMQINAGETVALVGLSGAGKSTVLQLLLRFFDPQSGAVHLNGEDIKKYSPHELRSLFAFVPQDTVVFAETIEANVRFGRPDATADEVQQALATAHCTEFIDALPDGLQTFLGERGVRLSGGQRQRLSIARAILRDAPVLLLDEATSSLDSKIENQVKDALDQLMKTRTTLVIAHRLSTVRNADKIIVLEGGKCVAEGTHGDLIEHDGLYAKLAKLQFTDKKLKQAV